MKKWLPMLTLALLSCQPKTPELDREAIKANYLQAAITHFPEITRHNHMLILGHLNEDDQLDGFIEYGEGEGMRPVSKKLVMLIKGKDNKIAFYPFHTDYCPAIDTIVDRKLLVKAYESCFEQAPTLLSKRYLYIKNTEIVEEIYWPTSADHLSALKRLKLNIDQRSDLHIHKLKFDDDERSEIAIEGLTKILNNIPLEEVLEKEAIENTFESEDQTNEVKIGIDGSRVDLILNSTIIIEDAGTFETSYFYYFQLMENTLHLLDYQIAG